MLTNPQLVTVAEIAQETYDTVESLASSLNAEQETLMAADVVTWNLNRDDVDVALDGASSDVSWKAQRLLDAIRSRTRKALGLSLVSSEVAGYSVSVPHVWIW